MEDTTNQPKRDLKALESRRRRGMRMLQRGMSQAEVARQLGVSRQSVSCWSRALAEGGQPWRGKQLGRPAGLSPADKRRLTRLINSGPGANGFPRQQWTLNLVGQLISREFGPTYSDVHVMRLLRAMGVAWQTAGSDRPLPRVSRPVAPHTPHHEYPPVGQPIPAIA